MASSEYWKEREKKWRKQQEGKEKDAQKRLKEVYKLLEAQISEQVNAWYQKYAEDEGMSMAQAKKHLSMTDIQYYARLAKAYCEQAAKDRADGTYQKGDSSKDYFTEQANAEMRRYNTTMKISRLEMIKSQIRLRIANAQASANDIIQKTLTDSAYQEFKRQAGILGNTVMVNSENAKHVVNASFHGQTFSQRIWGTHQKRLQKSLDKALNNAMILGKGIAPFSRELSKETGATLRQAQWLLSTELARVQVQSSIEAMKESGFEEFHIVASPSCCDACQKIDGKHYKIEDLASGDNAPPMHPNCRCSVAAYVDDDTDDDFDEAAFDEWSETYDEHGLSWEEWQEKKSKFLKSTVPKTVSTGARILFEDSEDANEWAEEYYAEIRKKTTDSAKIAERLNLNKSDIEKVKNYLFMDKSWLNPITNEYQHFPGDAAIAQSWQRLSEGQEYFKHDITLIRHELLEMQIKEANPDMGHEEAHSRAEAVYNYSKESREYYADRRKRFEKE